MVNLDDTILTLAEPKEKEKDILHVKRLERVPSVKEAQGKEKDKIILKLDPLSDVKLDSTAEWRDIG